MVDAFSKSDDRETNRRGTQKTSHPIAHAHTLQTAGLGWGGGWVGGKKKKSIVYLPHTDEFFRGVVCLAGGFHICALGRGMTSQTLKDEQQCEFIFASLWCLDHKSPILIFCILSIVCIFIFKTKLPPFNWMILMLFHCPCISCSRGNCSHRESCQKRYTIFSWGRNCVQWCKCSNSSYGWEFF